MKSTTCYFDAGDRCLGFRQANLGFFNAGQWIDKGHYLIPSTLNPIGMTADQLWQYRIQYVSTFDTLS